MEYFRGPAVIEVCPVASGPPLGRCPLIALCRLGNPDLMSRLLVLLMDCIPARLLDSGPSKRSFLVRVRLRDTSSDVVVQEVSSREVSSARYLHWDEVIDLRAEGVELSALQLTFVMHEGLQATAESDSIGLTQYSPDTRYLLIVRLVDKADKSQTTVHRLRIALLRSEKLSEASMREVLLTTGRRERTAKFSLPAHPRSTPVLTLPRTALEEFNAVFEGSENISARAFVELLRLKLSEELAEEVEQYMNTGVSFDAAVHALRASKRDSRGRIRSFHRASAENFIRKHSQPVATSGCSTQTLESSLDEVQRCLTDCERLMTELSQDLAPKSNTSALNEDELFSLSSKASFAGGVDAFEVKLEKLIAHVRAYENRDKSVTKTSIFDEASNLIDWASSLKRRGREELDKALRETAITNADSLAHADILSAIKRLQRIERRLDCIQKLYATSEEVPLSIEVAGAEEHHERNIVDVLCESAAAIFECSQQLLKLKMDHLSDSTFGRSIQGMDDFSRLDSFLDKLDLKDESLISNESIDRRENQFIFNFCSATLMPTTPDDLPLCIQNVLNEYSCIAVFTFVLLHATWSNIEPAAVDVYRWMRSRVYGETTSMIQIDPRK